MATHPFTIEPMAEYALLLRWPADSRDRLKQIQQLQRALSLCPWLEDVVASSHSLALIGSVSDHQIDIELQYWLRNNNLDELEPLTSTHHRLPVCYHPSLGLDLEPLTQALKLTTQQLIDAHLNSHFVVTSTGFRPGFAYLDGLDKALQLPRRSEPRLEVAAGSVAIAEQYSAVYPQSSPAGWHIIGACPLSMLDLSLSQPCRLALGDTVGFEAISLQQYQSWGQTDA